MASKLVGEKMKAKEAVGDPATPIPQEVVDDLAAATPEVLKALSVAQLKKISPLVDAAAKRNAEEMEKCEKARDRHLLDIGNVLHASGEETPTEGVGRRK